PHAAQTTDATPGIKRLSRTCQYRPGGHCKRLQQLSAALTTGLEELLEELFGLVPFISMAASPIIHLSRHTRPHTFTSSFDPANNQRGAGWRGDAKYLGSGVVPVEQMHRPRTEDDTRYAAGQRPTLIRVGTHQYPVAWATPLNGLELFEHLYR